MSDTQSSAPLSSFPTLTLMSSLQVVGAQLPYDKLSEVRDRLAEVSPNLTRYGDVEEANYYAQASALAQVRMHMFSSFRLGVSKEVLTCLPQCFFVGLTCSLKPSKFDVGSIYKVMFHSTW